MKWKATQKALGKEGHGWKQLKPGKVKQKRKFGLIYQPHLRTSCVCIVTPVSLPVRNSTCKEPCLGFEAFQLWLSALKSLIKCHGKGWVLAKVRAGVLRLNTVPEICTEFAKLHQFASWNCFTLHNLDSKMTINRPGSAVKRGERRLKE